VVASVHRIKRLHLTRITGIDPAKRATIRTRFSGRCPCSGGGRNP
jgi:hypothetical protein